MLPSPKELHPISITTEKEDKGKKIATQTRNRHVSPARAGGTFNSATAGQYSRNAPVGQDLWIRMRRLSMVRNLPWLFQAPSWKEAYATRKEAQVATECTLVEFVSGLNYYERVGLESPHLAWRYIYTWREGPPRALLAILVGICVFNALFAIQCLFGTGGVIWPRVTGESVVYGIGALRYTPSALIGADRWAGIRVAFGPTMSLWTWASLSSMAVAAASAIATRDLVRGRLHHLINAHHFGILLHMATAASVGASLTAATLVGERDFLGLLVLGLLAAWPSVLAWTEGWGRGDPQSAVEDFASVFSWTPDPGPVPLIMQLFVHIHTRIGSEEPPSDSTEARRPLPFRAKVNAHSSPAPGHLLATTMFVILASLLLARTAFAAVSASSPLPSGVYASVMLPLATQGLLIALLLLHGPRTPGRRRIWALRPWAVAISVTCLGAAVQILLLMALRGTATHSG